MHFLRGLVVRGEGENGAAAPAAAAPPAAPLTAEEMRARRLARLGGAPAPPATAAPAPPAPAGGPGSASVGRAVSAEIVTAAASSGAERPLPASGDSDLKRKRNEAEPRDAIMSDSGGAPRQPSDAEVSSAIETNPAHLVAREGNRGFEVVFANAMTATVVLYWQSDAKGLVYQFALAPGERQTMTTYDGQCFIAQGITLGPLISGVEVFRVTAREALAGEVVEIRDCRMEAAEHGLAPPVAPARAPAAPAAVRPPAPDAVEESLARVFLVSLAPRHSPPLDVVLLSELASELLARGVRRLGKDELEAALFARLQLAVVDLPGFGRLQSPFEYLVASFGRMSEERRGAAARASEAVRAMLDDASRTVVNYASSLLCEPTMFPSVRPQDTPAAELLRALKGGDAVSEVQAQAARQILPSLVEALARDDCVDAVVGPMVDAILADARAQQRPLLPAHLLPSQQAQPAQQMLDATPCAALATLCGEKAFGASVARRVALEERAQGGAGWEAKAPPPLPAGVGPGHPQYQLLVALLQGPQMRVSHARRLELHSLLGALLAPGCSPEDRLVLDAFWPSPLSMAHHVAAQSRRSFHVLQASLQAEQARLVLNLCRASVEAKADTMAWFARALELNAGRTRSHPDARQSSGDGLAINMAGVLLHVCRPFLQPGSTAVSKIDPWFPHSSAAWPQDTTRLGHPQQDVSEAAALLLAQQRRRPEREFSFVTQSFFYALRAAHLGQVAVVRRIGLYERQLGHMQRRMGGPDALGPHAPPSREKEEFEFMLQLVHAGQAVAFEPHATNDLLALYALYLRMLLLLADARAPGAAAASGGDPQNLLLRDVESVRVPLAAPGASKEELAPEVVLSPEHIVDDASVLLKELPRYAPDLLDAAPQQHVRVIMVGLVVLIASPRYLRSPHVRAGCAETLFAAFLPDDAKHGPGQHRGLDAAAAAAQEQRGRLLALSPLVCSCLAPGLLELYGDVEETGFYESKEHRHHIALMLKFVWGLEQHRAAFHRFASSTPERFVKFANGIINQTNDGVADSLRRLRDIRIVQTERRGPEWAALAEDDRRHREEVNSENEQFVASSLLLADEVLSMLSYLSQDAVYVRAFLVPALVGRLATMLSSILVSLSGSKGVEFKIDDPERYNFHPRALLRKVFETLGNLAAGALVEFADALAACAYYKHDAFQTAAATVRKFGTTPARQLDAFDRLNALALERAEQIKQFEADLGEAPEEFLDEIMKEVMDDPVLLPGSGTVVDRATIEQHLLNSHTDPFSRAQLTIEMVVPQPELKQRIQAWKKGSGAAQ
jgi:ubiquitin conjugation factor E4 B